ncbi:MAG: lipopolysaccharide biosynthesis protein RfbH [bacterium]|nr:lipopolysaccharide biosynthesis protein RfbH [bacterium]
METKENIRKEILEKVKDFYNIAYKEKQANYTPGKDIIPFAGRVYDEKELVNLVDSSLDFWLTAGRYAEDFEADFSEFMEQNYCILVNSGSSANLIALTTLTSPKLGNKRLKPGDEVITVAAGFPTTVNPIFQNNLVPVFVDVELETYNIDVTQLEKAYSPKTKAVMIAHTLGNPFNLDEVCSFCKKHDLYLIEDCCDAVGSQYDGKMVGTFGHIATTSFYPAHHMTMGEGGAVLTNDLELAQIATSFRDWGRDCYCGPGSDNTCGRRFTQQFGSLPKGYDHKYVYSHVGYNLKITDMQAAVGVAQLEKLPGFIKKRKDNFNKITASLEQYHEYLLLPSATKKSDPSWFGLILSVKENNKFTKNDLILYLEKNKIMTRQIFAGNMIRQPAYENIDCRIVGNLKNTDYVMNNSFFIGVYPGINDKKITYITSIFDKFFKKID